MDKFCHYTGKVYDVREHMCSKFLCTFVCYVLIWAVKLFFTVGCYSLIRLPSVCSLLVAMAIASNSETKFSHPKSIKQNLKLLMAKNVHIYVGYVAANISASTHDMILLDIEYQPQICRMCHRMILDRF